MFITLASLSGLIASIWIVCGLAIVGMLHGNYSHTHQFCSELGASTSPTEKISPLINNYPLGALFCFFGWYVLYQSNTLLITISGWLIIIHGLGTWVTGYFPMDADPYTKTPSRQCNIHALAGVVMTMTLLAAPSLMLFENITFTFTIFSLVCLLSTLIFLCLLSKAFNNRKNMGLYQRLSYGSQLLWLSGYTFIL